MRTKMIGQMIRLLAAGLVLAAVSVPSAAAHVFESQPRLTIRRDPTGTVSPGDRVLVFGRVRSGRDICKVGRRVVLFEKIAGPDRRIGTDETDAEGEYRFVLHPRRDFTVYVRVPRFFESSYGHSHECLRARSANLAIDVG